SDDPSPKASSNRSSESRSKDAREHASSFGNPLPDSHRTNNQSNTFNSSDRSIGPGDSFHLSRLLRPLPESPTP
ncbi:unnamed protein product, partial [Polarella glacialis]